jgi:hypothetical protein
MTGRSVAGNRDALVTGRHRHVAGVADRSTRPDCRDRTAGRDHAGTKEDPRMLRRLAVSLFAAAMIGSVAATSVFAGGPPHVGFYADGALYRTIGTPTDFSGTGAPTSSFEAIYALGGDLTNVAAAAPGDQGFRGGRWMVLPVTWNVTPVQLTSGDQVLAYAASGMLTIASTPVKEFECPVIPVH